MTRSQRAAIGACEYLWVSHGHPDHLSMESLAPMRDKQILLLLFNADADPIDFIFPYFGKRHLRWRLLCDSANGLVRPDAPIATGKTTIPGRGLLLFERTD